MKTALAWLGVLILIVFPREMAAAAEGGGGGLPPGPSVTVVNSSGQPIPFVYSGGPSSPPVPVTLTGTPTTPVPVTLIGAPTNPLPVTLTGASTNPLTVTGNVGITGTSTILYSASGFRLSAGPDVSIVAVDAGRCASVRLTVGAVEHTSTTTFKCDLLDALTNSRVATASADTPHFDITMLVSTPPPNLELGCTNTTVTLASVTLAIALYCR
jgi:hypothetical protein